MAAVYAMVPADEPRRIAGFYTLSAASVLLDELPSELVKKLPRYPSVPAILLGRLARDLSFPGLGERPLMDALARALRHSRDVAAAVVLVDAKDQHARRSYARYGFQDIPQSANRMFLAITVLQRLFRTG